ncbi:MAG: glycoside hydrolase family 44 protein [Rhodothermales bacterium]
MRTQGLFCALLALAGLAAGCDGASSNEPDPEANVVAEVAVSIDVDAQHTAISPLIYGSNQDRNGSVWTVRRLGGNRMTGYNWENNYSNAGSDFQHSSDQFIPSYLGIPNAEQTEPGRALTFWHDQSLQMGAHSVITLQLAGYVSADDFGTVTEAETAPSNRWVRVEPRKPAAFAASPDLRDGVVYLDELVAFLVRRYGTAASGSGVRFYSLDNEPALWPFTHVRIHPERLGAAELVDRSVAVASAVKDVDPDAEILGPALYGFGAYLNLQDAPDWAQAGQGATWFIDYYLEQMRLAEQSQGRRLLDVLDVHWYPEAQGSSRITGDGVSNADVEARVQAPRTLWDLSYVETSWIADCCGAFLPILPRLRSAIAAHYPGTKLAVTEYDYGAGHTISGGLAQADVLGAFGKYGVYLATRWGIEANDVFAAAAFKLYRNYDDVGGHFGDTSVFAEAGDRGRLSVYAAIEGTETSRLHVVLINKSRDGAVGTNFAITSDAAYAGAEVWGFDSRNAFVIRKDDVADIAGNAFRFVIEPMQAVHLVLE